MDEKKPYTPRIVNYQPGPGGKWEKPEPDSYWTLITKVYQPNLIPAHSIDMGRIQIPVEYQAAIGAKTWFYEGDSLHGDPVIENGCVIITKHMPNGRHQTSYIPLTEVLRLDYNSPSRRFMEAEEAWAVQEFGMSAEEVHKMNENSKKEMLKENLRQEIAQSSGMPASRVHIIDNGDGSFTAAIKPEDNDE